MFLTLNHICPNMSYKDGNLFLYWEKFRSTSYENADLFLYWEKFRSTSYKDVDLFLYWEKFRSTFNNDANLFFFKKNNCSHANLSAFKKKIITIT